MTRIWITYFKTSYVTVYQKAAVPFFRIQGTFQNIVCYCLSDFQLFSYFYINNFKTSYVTVYPAAAQQFFTDSISKHRMLLFINTQGLLKKIVKSFQNIVCYCLSFICKLIHDILNDFKTSYVTVYPESS